MTAAGIDFVWSVVGLPIAAVSVSVGIGLMVARGARAVGAPPVWIAALSGVLACGLALAGRVALLDGQLMMLAGLALAWWRLAAAGVEARAGVRGIVWAYALALIAGFSGARAQWSESGPALVIAFVAAAGWLIAARTLWSGRTVGRVGALDGREAREPWGVGWEAWTGLGGMLMGLGIVAVARVGVMMYAEAARAGREFGGSPLMAAAEVAYSAPYLGGLATQAPDGLLMFVVAAMLAGGGSGDDETPTAEGRRMLRGLVCVVAGAAMVTRRLVG